MKRLTIISHTEHYAQADGTIVGLGSTVTEINHLLEIFDRITHIAMLHPSAPPSNTVAYNSDRITFVSIPAVGGPFLSDKLALLKNVPKIIGIVKKCLESSDHFQFRAPTGIGVFIIPYLILFHKGPGWFKYAGHWKQPKAPLAYQFQKWLLEHQTRKVTINGFWPHQPLHCLSFENPCLTKEEVFQGQQHRLQKSFSLPLNFCFVGRLELEKGVDLIIEAFGKMEASHRKKVGTVHLVGDGLHMDDYKQQAKAIDVAFEFHGFLSRAEVHAIYKQCHALLLPSASEGFPKVITEAMNYGCIPIVSNISSIGHYIKDGYNGFLINDISVNGLVSCLDAFIKSNGNDYSRMISHHPGFIYSFTYEAYHQHLLDAVL